MQQAIHIFLKDARHWRWFIVLQLTMLAARTAYAAWNTAWRVTPEYDVLLPLAWWFLIAVVVYDENLDVSREFWITRPYSWRSLLAAKALFVAAFILMPLAIADVVTLAHTHFLTLSLVPDLLWSEFLRLQILLPAALLASLTRGIRQFLLVLLLLAIGIYNLAPFALRSPAESSSSLWLTLLLMALPIALVVWQYAQRRTWLVRGVAAAAYLFTFIPDASSISDIGPPHPEIAVRYSPETRLAMPLPHSRDRIIVALPIAVTGRDRNLVEPSLIHARVQSGGFRWETSWNWTNETVFTGSDWLLLTIPERDFDRLKQSPATVQAETAINLYDLERTISLPVEGPWTSLGAAGQARVDRQPSGLVVERRMALYDPGYKLVFGRPGLASAGFYPRNMGEVHISPVFYYGASIGNLTRNYENVQVERPIGRIKRTLHVDGVRLEDWVIAR